MSRKNLSSQSNSQRDSQVVDEVDAVYGIAAYLIEGTRHYHRGDILSGVLAGQANFEVARIYSDLSPGDNGDIEYDPEFDSRLDRFDGVEFGLRSMESQLEAKSKRKKDEEEK